MTIQSTFKIFFSPFDVDYEKVPLQLQMELFDLQCSENLKSKFLAWYILNFYRNHMLLSGGYLIIITHIQQVSYKFGTKYFCEQLFSRMKHAKSKLH